MHHLLSLCLSKLRSLLCGTSHYLNTWNRVKWNFGIMLRYEIYSNQTAVQVNN